MPSEYGDVSACTLGVYLATSTAGRVTLSGRPLHFVARYVVAGAFAGLVFSTGTLANDVVRPRRTQDLPRGTYARDSAWVVDGAIPVGFRPDQLYRDFPELREYFAKHPEELQPYLAKTFGVVGDLQPQLNGIRSTPFRTAGNAEVITRNASARNLELGDMRAGFVEVRHPKTGAVLGLVGVKGNGFKSSIGRAGVEAQKKAWDALIRRHEEERRAVSPDKRDELVRRHREEIDAIRTKDHSTGLVTVGEAFAELAKQRGIQAAMDVHNAKHGTNFQTNEVYGIIILPFHVLGPLGADGKPELQRAAIIVRQSEYRSTNLAAMRNGIPRSLVTDWYGFSQVTISGAVIDFGGVLAREPLLERIFHIADKKARDSQDALFTRVYGRGFEIGREVDEFLAGEGKGKTRAEAEAHIKRLFERELGYMLEPIEAERARALADPDAKKIVPEAFQTLAQMLLRNEGPLKPAQVKSIVDFIVQDKAAYLDARARRRDPENPALGYEGYGDYVQTRRRNSANLREKDDAEFELRRRLLEALLLREHRSLESFSLAVRSSRPEVRAFAWKLLPEAEQKNPAVLQAMQGAIRIEPGDSQHGIVALLRLLESTNLTLTKDQAARLLEQVLVARDPNQPVANYVDGIVRKLARRLSPERTVEAFSNAWKSHISQVREKQRGFFSTLISVANEGMPEPQRNELVERLRLEKYAETVPLPSQTVLGALQALRPDSRFLYEAHLRHLEQFGISSESFNFLVDHFPMLDRIEARELRQRALESLGRAVEAAKWSGQVADDVVRRARERLERLTRKPAYASVAACFGFLAGLLGAGN